MINPIDPAFSEIGCNTGDATIIGNGEYDPAFKIGFRIGRYAFQKICLSGKMNSIDDCNVSKTTYGTQQPRCT